MIKVTWGYGDIWRVSALTDDAENGLKTRSGSQRRDTTQEGTGKERRYIRSSFHDYYSLLK